MERTIITGRMSAPVFVFMLVRDILLVFLLIGIILLVNDLITFLTTRIIVTNQRIIVQSGLIHTDKMDSPLARIDSVQVKQGLLGKVCGYGTVTITTASTEHSYPYITHPYELSDTINNQIYLY